MAKEKEPEKKSNAPILIIGAVLVIALLGGWYWYSSSKSAPPTANNSTTNKNATPKAAATIPPNAPPGASPPNQTGSPTALVKLEEFADFQCGSCAAVHPTMNEIKSHYGSKIHFVFRNYPLPAHDKAYDAAVAAEAAGLQGKFWEMQNMLFNNQRNWSSDPNYKQTWTGYAKTIGLDITKWENDITGLSARTRVDDDLKRARAVGISGTPTLFINGVSIPFTEMNTANLKTLIDAELAKAAPQNQNSPASNAPANK